MASTLARFESSEFLPVGHLKIHVYVSPVDNEEAFHNPTVEACQIIRNYSGTFKWMRRSMKKCVEVCTEHHGRYFERLL
jgi:hypothetical protein